MRDTGLAALTPPQDNVISVGGSRQKSTAVARDLMGAALLVVYLMADDLPTGHTENNQMKRKRDRNNLRINSGLSINSGRSCPLHKADDHKR